ncbi:MAG: LysR family transcriptional regulator [Rhodospirillaceae bacterium]|nr:MAG: LysR family transcriptional regulator [Rhodospirillaceae bacterium]
MEIRRLGYFVRIAEEGSLSRASGVLGVAQPALSRQMRMLEDEVGVTLFLRTRRGMQLTEEGKHLHETVSGPLRQINLAFQNVRSFSSKIEGNVAIGMPATAEYVLAQPLVRRVSASLPDIKLRVVEGPASHLLDWLLKGEIDIAVLYGPCPNDKLSDRDLLVEELVLVGGPDSKLSPRKLVPFAKIGDYPLILPSLRPGIRSIVDKTAVRTKTKLNIQIESDSFQLTKELIESGMGYGVLPYSSFSREAESGRLKYSKINNPTITQYLIHAGRPLCGKPRIMAKLDMLIREEIAGLSASGKWPAKLLFNLEPSWPDNK